jgi:hypothetical protein
MFDNEVLIEKQDKEILLSNIKKINDILDKYPYSTNYSLDTATCMGRVKCLSRDAEQWIELLYTKND